MSNLAPSDVLEFLRDTIYTLEYYVHRNLWDSIEGRDLSARDYYLPSTSQCCHQGGHKCGLPRKIHQWQCGLLRYLQYFVSRLVRMPPPRPQQVRSPLSRMVHTWLAAVHTAAAVRLSPRLIGVSAGTSSPSLELYPNCNPPLPQHLRSPLSRMAHA